MFISNMISFFAGFILCIGLIAITDSSEETCIKCKNVCSDRHMVIDKTLPEDHKVYFVCDACIRESVETEKNQLKEFWSKENKVN